MDLGATICTPSKPSCQICPWAASCAALARGDAADFPRKSPKASRPTRYGTVFWLERPDGMVLLRRRAESGLLGGLMEIPSTPWREQPWDEGEGLVHSPLPPDSWRPLPGQVIHIFTHFRLELTVLVGRTASPMADSEMWIHPRDFAAHALPTLMKKVVRHRFGAARPR
jgi:A/G-specific adenine glycosylase